jgi:RNA polymerase sigma-70 factor (ECF subfamily)
MHTKLDDDFLKLISENKGIIIKICNSYCKSKNDREDVAQEIIYQLWKSNKSFNNDYKFSTWMYRIALNVAISFYRKGRIIQTTTVPLTTSHIDIEDTIFNSSVIEEKSALLQKQISELQDLDKALILLYFEEKSYKEIAEIIGITETNVATKVSRIKEKLKQNISKTKNNLWKTSN